MGSAEIQDRSLRTADYTVHSSSPSYNIGNLVAGACTTLQAGIPEVQVGDVTFAVPPPALELGLVVFPLRTDAAGQAKARLCNASEAAIDPANMQTYTFLVLR